MAARKRSPALDTPEPAQPVYRVVGGSIVFHDRDTAPPDSLVTLSEEEATRLLALGMIEPA